MFTFGASIKQISKLLPRTARTSAAARGLTAHKIVDQPFRCSSVAAPDTSYDEEDDDINDDDNDYQQEESNSSSNLTHNNKRDLDAYKIMNVERHFAINDEELKQSYRQLMNRLHPDKHGGKPCSGLEGLASEVTQSYQILKDPHTRATHLLQLMGKIDDNMDESLMGQLLGKEGNMLLMEVMEIREAIDEASSNEELEPMLEENNTRLESICNQLADAFETEDLDRALELTVTLQYFNRIDYTIREKMDVAWR